MTSFALFEYRSGVSFLHLMDPRAKLFLVCLFSLSLARTGWPGCIICLLGLGAGIIRVNISLVSLVKGLKYFVLFLGFIIITRGLVVDSPPLITGAGLSISLPGLIQGGLVAFRFFNIMILGLLFCAVTKPSDLNATLQWAAAPLPFIPEKRLGMIFGLALRFLPLIFRQANNTRDAVLLRSGTAPKRPVRQITALTLAIMTRVLRGADATAMAMEARCYTEQRTSYPFSSQGREPQILVAGAIAALLMIWF